MNIEDLPPDMPPASPREDVDKYDINESILRDIEIPN